MNKTWPFTEPPETASLTTQFVLAGSPILRVYRDYDGDWQFHGAAEDPATPEVGRVVSLGSMFGLDVAVGQLHDLPCGWCAHRNSVESPWVREKNNPFPTFGEDGYYLEDAIWMSQYRDDVHPPSESMRRSVPVGAYVKLLFRFASEASDRADDQTERMWVLVTGVDEDENYIGTLENDPHYADSLRCGDEVRFHSLHIMQILNENQS